MSQEFESEQNRKRRQAQDNLHDLQRLLEQIEESDMPAEENTAEAPAAEQKAETQTVEQPEETEPEETQPEETESEEAAAPQPSGDTSEQEAPAQQPDRQADLEQLEREAIVDRQAKRRHPEQPPVTVHLDAQKSAAEAKKSSAKQTRNTKSTRNTKNSKQKLAQRRKKRLMRLGVVIVVALVAVVLVVSAVQSLTGSQKPAEGSGSGVTASEPEQQDNRPASQRESEKYEAIKDDTTLPAYALEYPGLYADAVDEPNRESESKVCYLTFDDGPSSTNTPGILDVLKEKGVKATFFVVAGEIDGKEEILKRMVDEGHTLGIHCNVHKYGDLYSSVEGYLKDFAAAYDKIYELTGYRVQAYRFPGGSNNVVMKRHGTYDAIVSEMTRRGFEYYDWNAYAHDAEDGNYTVDQMVNYAVSEVCGSSRSDVILLMHDTYGKEKTVSALPSIIDKLQSQGIAMLPIVNATRPVHFEVDENTPPELPLPEVEPSAETEDETQSTATEN